MDRNEIVSYIQSMIQGFYHSNDKALIDKIANSQSFDELELTPPEVARLIMSCEEKYAVDLGDAVYPSIQSIADALMSVADVVNAANNSEKPANAPEEEKYDEDDQMPPPPESITIPEDKSIAKEETSAVDNTTDKEPAVNIETEESSTEEETSQEN